MKYLKLFENFNEELDEDLILSLMKEKGWGDLSYERIEDFKMSDHYKDPIDEQDFAEQFDDYLWYDDSMDDEYLRIKSGEGRDDYDDEEEEFGDRRTEYGSYINPEGEEYFDDEEEFDDDLQDLKEAKKSGVSTALKNKAKASGIPLGILRKVFSKGMQAWNAGHRPGVAQHQWGMGRVNSFITGSGGARKADADLWAKAKAAKARKKKKK